ncbi:MAG: DPP IV N-terminal domain-containing protein, partial [Eubacteriales bacterium]
MEFLEVLSNYLQSFRKKKERGIYKKVIAVIILIAFIVSTTNMVYIPQAFAAEPVVSPTMYQITSDLNNDVDPAWSSDGKKILFKRSQAIWLLETDGKSLGTNVKQVSPGIQNDWSPAWQKGTNNFFYYLYDAGYWYINRQEIGDSPESIYQVPAMRGAYLGQQASSPDGSKFTSAHLLTRYNQPYLDYGLYITDSNGSNRKQILFLDGSDPEVKSSFISHPSWSPDGTKIAFSSGINGTADIWVINVDGTGLTQITDLPGGEGEPAWSPDGEAIAFSYASNLWVINADSSGLQQLTFDGGANGIYYGGPDWSPDGKLLAFSSNKNGNPDIWTMEIELAPPPQVEITEPQDMISVKGKVPVSVQGTSTDSLLLTITDNISGNVVFQETVQKPENTWLWDSTGVIDGTYLINVQGINSMGNSAEDQVLVEVQNAVPSIGVSPFQAVNNYGLNAQQSGIVNYNGNLLLQGNDLTLSNNPVPLPVSRYYNSMQSTKGELGAGWHLGIPYLTPKLNGTVLYSNETGKIFEFIPDANGSYITPAGIRFRLYKQADGTYKLEHPASHVTWEFAINGLLRTVIDQNGNKVQYSYNGYKISEITDSYNRAITFAYNDGKISQVSDYAGRKVLYSYAGDYLTQVTRPDGMVDKYSYDAVGRITSAVDSNDNLGEVMYDSDGRVLTLTDTVGQSVYYSYAPSQMARTNQAGKTQMIIYDQNGQMTSFTDENGNMSIYEYDGRGNMVASTDQDGKITTYKYDTRDNLVEKKDPLGNITVYSYDSSDNLVEIKDPVDNTITYGYDGRNNRIRESYNTLLPDGRTTGYAMDYTYNERGNLI